MSARTDSPAFRRREIERWFLRRGVPQLIHGYGSESRMDARAAPFIAAWLLIGTVLFWGVNRSWELLPNVAGIAATLAVIGLGLLVLRPLGMFGPHRRATLSFPEILAIAALPALPSALIEGSAFEGIITFLNALLGIGVIYAVIALGLLELAGWAVVRLGSQVTEMVGLVGRTLPLLLILVVFLLFSAELWEAAYALSGAELAAVIGLLVLIGAVLIVTSVQQELEVMVSSAAWNDVLSSDPRTPDLLEPTAHMAEVTEPGPALSWLERANLVALALIGVLLQAASVALIVFAFLVAFGILVIPVEVHESWTGDPARVLGRFQLLGEPRGLTAELLTVSGLLSGIVGLYFTGLAVTDGAHRGEYLGRLLAELRLLLAVRAWYHVVVRQEGSADAADRLVGARGFEPPTS